MAFMEKRLPETELPKSMERTLLTVVHQETSDPGLVGQILRDWGYHIDQRCPALGEALPDNLSSYDGVIIFGGPMSANDDGNLAFIAEELRWVETVLSAEVPFLGICLGAQLLARTLGAKVEPHPHGLREIGYFPLQPVAVKPSPFEQPMHVYHWHQEGFELPFGGELLARGNTFAHQAFRYGDRTYGLQFHPEITVDLIHDWTARGADQLELPGAQPRSLHFHHHEIYGDTVAAWLSQFLCRWLLSALQSQAISA